MPAKGDGITKRKDGRYMARYTVHTPDGPKRAETPQGASVYDDENLTVGEYLKRWLSDSVRDTVRQRTYEGYEHIVERHMAPALGQVKLESLTPAHVRGLYRERLDSGPSPRTVQYVHTTLNKTLKQAVGDGPLDADSRTF